MPPVGATITRGEARTLPQAVRKRRGPQAGALAEGGRSRWWTPGPEDMGFFDRLDRPELPACRCVFGSRSSKGGKSGVFMDPVVASAIAQRRVKALISWAKRSHQLA